MDIVYVCRDGENPELRYSLRSLMNVPHYCVFIFGGSPSWVAPDFVRLRPRNQKPSPYASTRAHIKAACEDPDVSDPFILMNDDFYVTQPVERVPFMHRGPLDRMIEEFASSQTPWARGIRETAVLLRSMSVSDPLSYDLHAPLVVYKAPMLEALKVAKKARVDAVHVRTLYGNMAALGGEEIQDPKMLHRSAPFPRGPWLSSGSRTFRATVEPVLRYLFPNPWTYERK